MKSIHKYLGIIYIIISAFCFAFMNMFVRLAGDLPPTQKCFFRNFIALIFAIVILCKDKIPFKLENKSNWFPLFIRAFIGTLGILCNFYAIDHLVLADASILNKMSPFFVIIFSFLFLREKLTFFQGAAVVTAFIGTLFIIKPSFNMEFIPALLGLIGGMCAGAAYTAVRYLGNHGEKGPFIVAFFSAFSCISMIPFLIFDYHPMSLKQLIFLIGAGFSAAGGQFSITAAYTKSPASEISVYDYSQIIFATVLGFIVFGDVPDVYSFIGYFIIVAAAVLVFFYNNFWRYGKSETKTE